jgi:hypothetical protein
MNFECGQSQLSVMLSFGCTFLHVVSCNMYTVASPHKDLLLFFFCESCDIVTVAVTHSWIVIEVDLGLHNFEFQFISLNRFSASLFASPKVPFHTSCKLSPPRTKRQWPEDMRVVLFAATHSIAAHFSGWLHATFERHVC